MVLGAIASVDAQANIEKIEEEVVLQNVDKNTQLALVYKEGVLVEKGTLKNGKREGVWQSFDQNGNLLTEASFSKGVKNGVWIVYDQSQVKYVLYYENDKRVQANDLAIAR